MLHRHYLLGFGLLLASCRAAPQPKFRSGPLQGGYAGSPIEATPLPRPEVAPGRPATPEAPVRKDSVGALKPTLPLTIDSAGEAPEPPGAADSAGVGERNRPVRPYRAGRVVPLAVAAAAGLALLGVGLASLPAILVLGVALGALFFVGGVVVLGARTVGRWLRRRKKAEATATP